MKIYLTKGIVRFKDKYLLLKKVKDMVPENAGKWECSGGKIGKDEGPKKALLREIKEETGLGCEIVKELPFLKMKNDNYESSCHVYLVQSPSDKVKLSPEHSEYIWIRPEEVKDMPLVLFADLLLEYFNHAEKYLE
jgi:8-oxo-dGTP diphosphatase|tara:strand:+ start:5918 stop:6325 length:408 start_codon:yes stop_codon:yes gene_type:complete